MAEIYIIELNVSQVDSKLGAFRFSTFYFVLENYMYCGRHSECLQGFSDVEDVNNSAAKQENDSDVSNDLDDLQICHN